MRLGSSGSAWWLPCESLSQRSACGGSWKSCECSAYSSRVHRKKPAAGSVYADITWTGFVGAEIPARQREVFAIVRAARDAALNFVRSQVATGRFPCGWEVDEVCRTVIRKAGYSDRFVHRTGHSIGEEVHGNGANIDSFETKDGRRLMPRTCFSIEPGIYLPGEFGIRSELDVYVSSREAHVFGQPVQQNIVPILG